MHKNFISRFIIVLGLTLILTACTSPVAGIPLDTSSAINTADEGQIETNVENTSAEDEMVKTITITDFDGRQVEVPANPQRIVALSEKDIDAAVTLRMPLVGVVNGRGSMVPPTYLADYLEGVTSVGAFTEPSLETILALKPDLILIGGIFPGIADLVEPLSEIAPTVVTYGLTDTWNDSFLKSAAAMNREAEAQLWLETMYQTRVNEVRDLVGDSVSTAGIIRFNPDGPVIMAVSSFSSLIAQDVGLVRPETQQIEGVGHGDTLSLEQIGNIDADYLFISSLNPDGSAALEDALATPLYQSLNAVSGGYVYIVDGAAWTTTGGPSAALLVLDDIAAAVTE